MKLMKSCPHCHHKIMLSLYCAFGKVRKSKLQAGNKKQHKIRQFVERKNIEEETSVVVESRPMLEEKEEETKSYYMYRGID